jgi:hypothetical protein
MPKKKKMSRRRNGFGSSYSKPNIAMGSALGSIVPKFTPGFKAWLPLLGLIPKAPVPLKVMSWTIATKQLSDKYIGGNE